jgi:hypothetical protein
MKPTNQLTGFLAKLVFITLFFPLVFAGKLFSQEVTTNSKWKLNFIELTTGETPLSSGLNVDVLVSKGKNSFYLSYNKILGQVVYEIPLTKWFSIYPTGGIFCNVPWAGPMFTFKMFEGKLITNHWFGWSTGIPEEGEASLKNTIFIFSFQEVKYSLKKTSFNYVLMHYEKNAPIHLMGLKRMFQLNESLFITSSFTYVLRENKDRTLWSLGFVWKFND